MPESSWLQTVSFQAKRHGNSTDARNALWYQGYCLQVLWRTPWKAWAANTSTVLKPDAHIFRKTSEMRSICRALILK